jgi:predicted Fe-Mo cluster-binding NifX family protein
LDKIRIAIATRGYKGLEDKLSKVYGKAKTFTIVDIEDGEVKNVRIVDNPGATYNQGSGPIASKTLAEMKIDLIIASQLGPGALELLRHHRINTTLVDVNSTIAEAIEEALSGANNQNL